MSIVVENLTKKYGQQVAVDNISFRVNTGEIVGFLGPNGAGKSTTMKMITCYMSPDSGNILINQLNTATQAEEIKKLIGYLPENNPLYLDMAIADYLRFCAEIQGVPRHTISSRIAEMIEICGLTRERHKKIGELSKGYRQRVGLAQAMIHNPEVLILDEPTSGLDPNQIIEIRNLIKTLGKAKTVVFSSHILSEVEATCDRILIINKGRLVADSTPELLRNQAQGQELIDIQIEAEGFGGSLAAFIEGLETVEAVHPISGKPNAFRVQSRQGTSSKKKVFELCVQNGWYLLELKQQESSLEDVFRELTK